MGSRDVVALMERIYDCQTPELEWLSAVASHLSPFMPESLGAVAYRFKLGESLTLLDEVAVVDGPQEWCQLPHALLEHAPATVAHDAYCSTAPILAAEAYSRELWTRLVPPEVPDGLALLAHDPRGDHVSGAICFYPLAQLGTPTARQRHFGSQITSHIGAALRLRHRLAESSPLLDQAHGVVDANGSIQHASADFGSKDGQAKLRELARKVDHAKKAARHDDPQALDPWTALASGRWSMVDQFDTDGRRYFVVVDNPLQVADARSLTERERHVLAFAAVGYTNIATAYHLGLDEASVSRAAHSGMRKLGIVKREELVKGFSNMALQGAEHGHEQ